jgi:hypothetical protein
MQSAFMQALEAKELLSGISTAAYSERASGGKWGYMPFTTVCITM